MAAVNKPGSSSKMMKPATTPEARENQLIALATDLVEKRLREGTASSQETTHFLKLATAKSRIEKEILEKQRDLIVAKTEEIKRNDKMEEMYANVIAAMRKYQGLGSSIDGEENDDY